MELFKNLLSDSVGLMSLGTIVFVIIIAIYFIIMFIKKSAQPDQ
ncbi:MAG: DUF3149 domain-containing protein [Gammaproteobacteria bacterium]|nr:DUF3149 domain-containing protein [Gammaproteobacteria bacterium]MBL6999532.1 DUF3149 domain-containing protein [Gammaproteobacteria bacterium]